jgi:CDP-diglyceride synthetase
VQEPQVSEYEKKKQTFITRSIWTFVMIGGFFGAMFAGHIYIIVIITAVQIISFKEVIAIASVPSRARRLRFTKALNWYWLATTMYFLYGESVIYYFKHIVLVDKVLLPFATHHRFISFMLYVIGNQDPGVLVLQGLTDTRIRIFCCILASWTLPIPVYPIRMDSHGVVSHCRPSSLYHEQCLRGDDMVLPPCFIGHLQ